LIGYAERYCLSPGAVESYRHACVLVDRVSHEDRDGYEVRCHELSRAVARQLAAIGTKVEVVDGALWWVDHSWILLPGHALLDVYAPGRVPQVQLLHDYPVVTQGYERGPARLDVRADVVDALCRLMEFGPREATWASIDSEAENQPAPRPMEQGRVACVDER